MSLYETMQRRLALGHVQRELDAASQLGSYYLLYWNGSKRVNMIWGCFEF
jgi:hypothetical protein